MKYQTEVSAEGLAEDPTGFTTNRSDYSYVETTSNQINSEVNKSSHFLEKEKMKTSSAIKINNGNSSMDVIDNELETSSNGVPNTSNNTQSERSMVSADDYDDTYMAQSNDVYDHTDDRRHKVYTTHPSIYIFIDVIKQIQSTTYITLCILSAV